MFAILKKKSAYSFSILVMVIIFASCSKTPENTKTPDNTKVIPKSSKIVSSSITPANLKVIPKTSTIVSSINVFSIATKARLDKLSELQIFKEVMKKTERSSVDSIIGSFFKQVMENPLSSGIDVTGDLYIFNTTDDFKKPTIGASIKIADKKKFNQFVSELSNVFENKTNIVSTISDKKNDINFLNIKNTLHIGWDKEKAILLSTSDIDKRDSLPAEIEKLMSLSLEDQIISKAEFNTYHSNKKDISVWASTNMFKKDYEYKKIVDQVGFDLKDIYINLNLEFNEDQIKITTELVPNKGYNVISTKLDKLIIPFNKEVAGMFSKDYNGLLAFGLDFSKIGEAYANENAKEIIGIVEDKMSAFGGSFLINFYDIEVKKGADIKPKFAIGFDISDKKKINTLIDQMVGMGIFRAENNYFVGNIGEISFSLGLNNNLGMVSFDEVYVSKFANGENPRNTLLDEPILKEIENNAFYSYLKLDIEDYSDEFKKFVKAKDVTPKKTAFSAYQKLFKSIEFKRISANKTEFNLNFKESKDNILKDLINISNQAYLDNM